MKFKDFLRGKKTRWILPTAVAAVVVVIVVVVMMNNAATTAALAQSKVVTKDTTVQKGNITVGVSETGTASIATTNVLCNVPGAVIQEIKVKAGQSVKKGDPVATLTQASVNAAVQAEQITYDDAMTKLKQAQSAQATTPKPFGPVLQYGSETLTTRIQPSISRSSPISKPRIRTMKK